MGSMVGHVLPGVGFFVIGLWHLFNNITLHARCPISYTSSPWFPTSRFKYLELFFIIGGSCASVSAELFIGPDRHQPFDPDGTIPSNHLRNFEHAAISMTLLVYAVFAIVIDRIGTKAPQYGLTMLLCSIAFAQELLLFHLHSSDHRGPEGQYHLLLQIVTTVSLVTTLMGIGLPKSFLVSFIRSASILLQGIWFIITGFMLWTPALIPKGCFINDEDGHKEVKCPEDEANHRAKSLTNILFSWLLIAFTIFAVWFYLVLVKAYGEKVEYVTLKREEEHEDQDHYDDVESQKKSERDNSRVSLIQMGKTLFTN